METSCFRAHGSNAVWSAHNVPLLRGEAILNKLASTPGRAVYCVCPEGRQIVDDPDGSGRQIASATSPMPGVVT